MAEQRLGQPAKERRCPLKPTQRVYLGGVGEARLGNISAE